MPPSVKLPVVVTVTAPVGPVVAPTPTTPVVCPVEVCVTLVPPLITTALAAWAVNVETIAPTPVERVKSPPVDVAVCERPPVRVMAAATVLLAVTAVVAADVKFTAPAVELVAVTEVAPQVEVFTAPVTPIPVLLTKAMASMLATVTSTNGLMAVPIEVMLSVSPAPAPPSILSKAVRVIAPAIFFKKF